MNRFGATQVNPFLRTLWTGIANWQTGRLRWVGWGDLNIKLATSRNSKTYPPPKNKHMTMEHPPWIKIYLYNYFLWNMVIFQCHVSFQGCNSSRHLVTELQLYCRRCYKMLVLLQLLQPTCAKVRFFLKCWKNAFGFGIGTRGYELLRPLLYLTSSSLKSRFHLQWHENGCDISLSHSPLFVSFLQRKCSPTFNSSCLDWITVTTVHVLATWAEDVKGFMPQTIIRHVAHMFFSFVMVVFTLDMGLG